VPRQSSRSQAPDRNPQQKLSTANLDQKKSAPLSPVIHPFLTLKAKSKQDNQAGSNKASQIPKVKDKNEPQFPLSSGEAPRRAPTSKPPSPVGPQGYFSDRPKEFRQKDPQFKKSLKGPRNEHSAPSPPRKQYSVTKRIEEDTSMFSLRRGQFPPPELPPNKYIIERERGERRRSRSNLPTEGIPTEYWGGPSRPPPRPRSIHGWKEPFLDDPISNSPRRIPLSPPPVFPNRPPLDTPERLGSFDRRKEEFRRYDPHISYPFLDPYYDDYRHTPPDPRARSRSPPRYRGFEPSPHGYAIPPPGKLPPEYWPERPRDPYAYPPRSRGDSPLRYPRESIPQPAVPYYDEYRGPPRSPPLPPPKEFRDRGGYLGRFYARERPEREFETIERMERDPLRRAGPPPEMYDRGRGVMREEGWRLWGEERIPEGRGKGKRVNSG
jgi:hypothetical protein